MAGNEPNFGQAVGGVFRSLARFARAVADRFDTVVDFATVKVFGLPFIVLGYRGAGKTTLLEWLRHDQTLGMNWSPEPTAAGGDAVPPIAAHVGADGKLMRIKPRRDVGGEHSMWETDWAGLFQEAKPRGIIFMIDHTNVYQHKDALNYVLQMLEDEALARRPLRMFLLLVNKSDQWEDEKSLEEMLEPYKNELRRLESQANRLKYDYRVSASSLVTENGADEALIAFFDAIRPRPQTAEA